ncbi:MAG: asparaginase [Gemmatimonadetes bacterium]|nr:asparaginase [Gemmatimonadota bacterium]
MHPQALELDVIVTRGPLTESRHLVHGAAVSFNGDIVASARNVELETMWRSCSKMFQVIPFLASGGFDQLQWTAEMLSLACASHGGEPEHVALAARMLESAGLTESDLACGPHEPLSVRGERIARESGAPLTRLHNNCSGKHAAMLARAKTAGWPTHGYEKVQHAVQQSCLAEVAMWTDVPVGDLRLGVDGCGVVVMGLPLDRMALAYGRWAQAIATGDEIPSRTAAAIAAHPHLLGGTDRFDTILIEETNGAVISKVGAEGVHCAAVPGLGLGVAIKVEDGSLRAQHIAILTALQAVGALPAVLPPRLADWLEKPVKNTRGDVVGAVRSARPI